MRLATSSEGYCVRCGAELPENAKFCSNCGNAREYTPAEPTYTSFEEMKRDISDVWGDDAWRATYKRIIDIAQANAKKQGRQPTDAETLNAAQLERQVWRNYYKIFLQGEEPEIAIVIGKESGSFLLDPLGTLFRAGGGPNVLFKTDRRLVYAWGGALATAPRVLTEIHLEQRETVSKMIQCAPSSSKDRCLLILTNRRIAAFYLIGLFDAAVGVVPLETKETIRVTLPCLDSWFSSPRFLVLTDRRLVLLAYRARAFKKVTYPSRTEMEVTEFHRDEGAKVKTTAKEGREMGKFEFMVGDKSLKLNFWMKDLPAARAIQDAFATTSPS